MATFEKYCDKCGEPTRQLKNVDGKMLCPKCRGLRFESDEEETRKQKLRRLWADSR